MSLCDITYPRLNILRYWMLIPGFIIIFLSFTIDTGCATGWTIYPPLSSKTAHISHRVDSMILIIHVLGCSRIISSINFVRTVIVYKNREESDLHVFIWAVMTSSCLLVISLPVLGGGVTLLIIERNFNSSYFDINRADVILFQHLFWFFAHPEVYVLILPTFGVIRSSVTFVCAGEEVFSKTTIVYCILSITLIACVVYGHHQYTVGLDLDTRQYFRRSTIIISVPTAIKVLRWLIALLRAPSTIQPTLNWIIAFITLFTIGAVTAIILSNTSVDILLHDTYFTTSHFHQVLRIASVFAIFCRLRLLYPSLTALVYFCSLIDASFWLIFLGVNFIFVPQYILAVNGLPRKFPENSVFYRFIRDLSKRANYVRIVAVLFIIFTIIEPIICQRGVKNRGALKIEETSSIRVMTMFKHGNTEDNYVTILGT